MASIMHVHITLYNLINY